MSSTDDEHEVLSKAGPRWRAYEEDVQRVLNEVDGATVTHDVHRIGKISGTDRQIDVLIEGFVAGIAVTIVVECKNYAKPIGIGKVDEFAGKLADLQLGKGVIYALNGLTGPARQRAAGGFPAIDIRDLAPSALPLPPWGEYVRRAFKLGDCQNENCIAGDVDWEDWPQSDGAAVKGGSCRSCGTWAVDCVCGEKTGFFTDEESCAACGRTYALVQSQDGADVIDVVETSGPVE